MNVHVVATSRSTGGAADLRERIQLQRTPRGRCRKGCRAAEAIYPRKINLFQVSALRFCPTSTTSVRAPLKSTHPSSGEQQPTCCSALRVWRRPITKKNPNIVKERPGARWSSGHGTSSPAGGERGPPKQRSGTRKRPPLEDPGQRRARTFVRTAFLTAHGRRYPDGQVAHFENLTIDRGAATTSTRLDHRRGGRRAEKVQKAVGKQRRAGPSVMKLDDFHSRTSNVGFISRKRRIRRSNAAFLAGTNLQRHTNMSNVGQRRVKGAT